MKQLILAGGGHAHLHVLRSLAAQPWPGVEVVMVSPHRRQIYSGMLPGWLSGHYSLDQCAASLTALATAAGVRFIQDRVTGVDASRQMVRCADHGDLRYDVVSIDTGAMVDTTRLATTGAALLPVRPLEAFVVSWENQLARFVAAGSARVAVVGAGAAGVELALAARYRLVNLLGADRVEVFLVEGRGLLSGHGARVVNEVARQLDSHGVRRLPGHVAGSSAGLVFTKGDALAVDCVIAATGVVPAQWLATSDLTLAHDGFIAVDAGQRSISHTQVFAAGDVATRMDQPHAKSGVYAVRAGPALSANLQRSLSGQAIRPHSPQRRTLYLLATGPREAVVSWSGLTAAGAWAWRWKDWIDRRFMKQYIVPDSSRKASE